MRAIIAALILYALISPAVAGNASHYGEFDKSVGHSYYGRKTACGNIHRPGATTAHRSLPCGTKVHITNKKTGQSGVVTVTDRGPFIKGRVWDLNSSFARSIGCPGVCNVSARVLGR